MVQEKKRKIDFRDGGHLEFPIGTILAIFDLQVTPILLTKFQVNWPVDSGEEAKKIDVQDGGHGGPLGFPIGTMSIGFSFQEKKRKIYFQDGGHCGHLGFPIEMIFANFDLQVTSMLPTKFKSIGLLVQEKKQK